MASQPRLPRMFRPLRRMRRLRLLTAQRRTAPTDLALATILAFIAGSANAGGFLALGEYTSHMTGYLSQLADNIALMNLALVLQSLVAITLFVTGAACSAALINWARHRDVQRQYGWPIALQGLLFLIFAAIGGVADHWPGANGLALGLLCFIMGLQNATITKISGARIRTTHATGMITDLGIALGRSLYRLASGHRPPRTDTGSARVLLQLLGSFLAGGITGALGYGAFGFLFSLPMALLLLALAAPSFRRRPACTLRSRHSPR